MPDSTLMEDLHGIAIGIILPQIGTIDNPQQIFEIPRRRCSGNDWPDVSDAHLETWLEPHLDTWISITG